MSMSYFIPVSQLRKHQPLYDSITEDNSNRKEEADAAQKEADAAQKPCK